MAQILPPPATCPHCDSPNFEHLSPTNPLSEIAWYRCADCGRLFTPPNISLGLSPARLN